MTRSALFRAGCEESSCPIMADASWTRTPAAIDVLREIATAVDGRIEVLLDSGVRRGTDVLVALALGAKAVLLGRPYAWALAADGEKGVSRALSMLRNEFDTAMALVGCSRAAEIDASLVRRRS